MILLSEIHPIASVPLQKKLKTEVQNLAEAEMVQPLSSPWVSPLVPDSKKDGKIRCRLDYRKLNEITTQDVYSTIDLSAGYWQIAIASESRPNTGFVTYECLYEWLRVPMGFTNAPANFERMMGVVLQGFK